MSLDANYIYVIFCYFAFGVHATCLHVLCQWFLTEVYTSPRGSVKVKTHARLIQQKSLKIFMTIFLFCVKIMF